MPQRLAAEFVGTALLLIGVVGSGIMGETLSGGNIAIAMLANAIATGCMLYVIITVLGPVSGAHFNPVVTAAFVIRRNLSARDGAAYIAVQIPGALFGVWIAHAMFDQPILQVSTTLHRTGLGQWTSEVVATLGLLLAIFGGLKSRPEAVPALVGLYITGAYWFTSSTSFANPAVTIARGFTDTFAGIAPHHILPFIAAQCVALALSLIVVFPLFTKN